MIAPVRQSNLDTEIKDAPIRNSQFSIRSMLVAFVAMAILMAAFVYVRYYYFQFPFHPSTSLVSPTQVTEAVDSINCQLVEFALPEHLKLNDWEIIDAVKGQRAFAATRVNDSQKLSKLCDMITLDKTLPAGSKIDMSRGGTVTLEIPIDATSGYGFVVRHPGHKRDAADEYTMNFGWQPNTDQTYNWTGSNWQTKSRD